MEGYRVTHTQTRTHTHMYIYVIFHFSLFTPSIIKERFEQPIMFIFSAEHLSLPNTPVIFLHCINVEIVYDAYVHYTYIDYYLYIVHIYHISYYMFRYHMYVPEVVTINSAHISSLYVQCTYLHNMHMCMMQGRYARLIFVVHS